MLGLLPPSPTRTNVIYGQVVQANIDQFCGVGSLHEDTFVPFLVGLMINIDVFCYISVSSGFTERLALRLF